MREARRRVGKVLVAAVFTALAQWPAHGAEPYCEKLQRAGALASCGGSVYDCYQSVRAIGEANTELLLSSLGLKNVTRNDADMWLCGGGESSFKAYYLIFDEHWTRVEKGFDEAVAGRILSGTSEKFQLMGYTYVSPSVYASIQTEKLRQFQALGAKTTGLLEQLGKQ